MIKLLTTLFTLALSVAPALYAQTPAMIEAQQPQ
jgi:hypothetical protein